MTLESILALCLALAVLAATPGPGVFATISRSLASGFGPGLVTVCGIVIGDLVYLSFAVFGLAVAAHLLGDFFVIVRVGGGLYVVWLGWRMWTAEVVAIAERPDGASQGALRDFTGGLVITLGNPNVILFYAGFLPTFLDLGALTPWDGAVLVGCVMVVIGGALALYAALAARARRLFRSPRAVRRLNRCSGGMMMGVGMVVATRA